MSDDRCRSFVVVGARRVLDMAKTGNVLQVLGRTPDERSVSVLDGGRSLEVVLILSTCRSCCALPAFIGFHSPFS